VDIVLVFVVATKWSGYCSVLSSGFKIIMYVITSTIRFFQYRRDPRLNKPKGTAWHSLVQYSTVHRGACTVHPESIIVRHCAIPLLRAYSTC